MSIGTVLSNDRQPDRRADHGRLGLSRAPAPASGRGDRRGAFRTAATIFVAQVAALLLRARHYTSFDIESSRVIDLIGVALFSAVIIWLFYMAFEPYVRRFWPTLLIGWTRLMSGHVRDPLVGRDILIGAAAGTVAALLTASRELIPELAGLKLASPGLPQASILLGTRYEVVAALETLRRAFNSGFEVVCVVVFLKILVRRTWLVMLLGVVVILPIAMNGACLGEHPALELLVDVGGIAMILGVLLRLRPARAHRDVLHIHGDGSAAAHDRSRLDRMPAHRLW